MKLSTNNFLTFIKQLVTGGGFEKDGVTPTNDAGFLRDMYYDLFSTLASPGVANAVKQTIILPIQLADLANAQTWKIALPFAGTINSIGVRIGKPASTAAKAATLTAQVNGTPVTGGVVSLTSANATPTGAIVAGTAVTALNTFTAGQTIEAAISSVTAFVEGDGWIEFNVTNSDSTALMSGTASETNLKVLNIPASNTGVGTLNVVIPRDYDEATDVFTLHVGVAMSGSTDTPGLAASAFRKRAGASIATVDTAVTAKVLGTSTAAALSSAEKNLVFSFAGKGLRRDDALTIVLTSDAHTTDAILVYYVKPVYRSTLVSYHETDGTRDGKDGNYLR